MIEYTSGDILRDEAEALVNTVNCVGVMGRGIALQFKKAWPENFRADPDSMRGQMRGQLGFKTGRDAAGTYKLDEDNQNLGDDRNVLPDKRLREEMRDVAGKSEVRLLGLEPRTYGLKVRCSTD